MDTKGRAWQWYGYAVCLTAVITGLLCASAVINNAFDLANPLLSSGDGSLMSYETYRASREPRMVSGPDERPVVDTTSEETRRARFEAMRAERIATRRFQAMKALVTSLVLLAIASTLFVTHWRWLRRRDAAQADA